MPTVQRYGEPKVQAQGIPSVRVSAAPDREALGGGDSLNRLNAANQGMAGVVQKIAIEEREKADDAVTKEGYAELLRRKNELLWNTESGAYTRKGKDAFGVIDEYGAQFDKHADEIEKSLIKNNRQREIFNGLRLKIRGEFDEDLQKHTFKESQAYNEQVTESGISAAQNDAVLNYQDPKKIISSIETQKALIASGYKGKPPDFIKVKIAEATSKTHVGVISRMLANGDDLYAKNYYNAIKEELAGTDVSAVEKALEEGSIRGESQRQSDDIWAKTNGDVSKAMVEAKKIEDAKLRDEVERRIHNLNVQAKQAERDNREQMYLNAANIVDGAPKGADVRRLVSPTVWSQLSVEQRNALERRAEDLPNNDKTWLDFLALPSKDVANLSRAEFETKYWVHLDKSHRAKAEAQWNAARESAAKPGKTPKEIEFKSIYSDNQMIVNALASAKVAGIAPGETLEIVRKDAKKAAAYTQFSDRVDEAFKAYHAQTGKNPDDATKKKIISDMLMRKVFVNDGWFTDSEKPVAALTPEEMKKVYKPIASIPPRAKLELINIARAHGIIRFDVSDDRAALLLKKKIERAYATRLAGARIEDVISIMTED